MELVPQPQAATGTTDLIQPLQVRREELEKVFAKDEIGNLIVTGSVFNGTKNIRVKILDKRPVPVMEVIEYIMAVTGKERNDAGEVWRNFSDAVKNHLQNDLHINERESDFVNRVLQDIFLNYSKHTLNHLCSLILLIE